MARSFTSKAIRAVAVLAALGAGGYAARDTAAGLLPKPAPEVAVVAERPAQPVRVTRVVFAAQDATETYTGTIRPQHEAPLAFRLPGKLIARAVEVGDRVAAGQVVAQLDDTDARLEREAAAADLAAARTDLSRAEDDLARSRDLFAAGHVAQAALDRAISAAAEAQSRADRAARTLDLAENRLTYMELVAEAPGIVTATFAETGQVVAAGQPVLTVAATDPLDVVFALPEQRRDLLDTATASAVLWGAEGAPYALTLRDISPDVDPAGRTYRVRMTLTAPDAAAALGRTVTVRLATAGGPPAATLPLAAVLNDGAGAAVWRLPPGAALVERVPVEVVAVDGRAALLRGRLAEGDIVVSLGGHKIDPARPVRVVETSPTPES
jgi:RND family efflux transporter MFP subunit